MMKRPKTLSSSNSRNRGSEENSETIPLDLVIEILKKLPVKSIARFRCVSKLWESTLRSPNFTESFLTISSSRPKLLFTFLKDGKTFFFTSPQPQNTSILTANFHMSVPIVFPNGMRRPVRGLVCGFNQHKALNGDRIIVPLICNPSTGQSLALPEAYSVAQSDNLFRVLTLGTGKELSWRWIKCDVPHCPVVTESPRWHYVCDYICINGVLYYLSWVNSAQLYEIFCFEIRSEKFKCIRIPQGMGEISQSLLVNYKGKVATLNPSTVNGIRTGIRLWVLDDAENLQWSSYFYVLPPPWNNIFEETKLNFVGMTSIGEIVLAPNTKSDSFYLLYYNTERKIITKVEVQGMEAFKPHKALICPNHVEDVKLMPVSNIDHGPSPYFISPVYFAEMDCSPLDWIRGSPSNDNL